MRPLHSKRRFFQLSSQSERVPKIDIKMVRWGAEGSGGREHSRHLMGENEGEGVCVGGGVWRDGHGRAWQALGEETRVTLV